MKLIIKRQSENCQRFCVRCAKTDTKHTSCSATSGIENAVRIGDHHRESLEDWIRGIGLTNAHEEVFKTLDVNAHDLGDEIANLILLDGVRVKLSESRQKTYQVIGIDVTLECHQDCFQPGNPLLQKIAHELHADSRTERKK